MSRKKCDLSLRFRVFRSMLVLGIFLLFVTTAMSGQTPPEASLVGSEACLDCHDDIGAAFPKTIHGVTYTQDGSKGAMSCESCHGPGSAHVEEQAPALIINPAKDDPFGEQTLCVTCHNTAMFDDWAFASHNVEGVKCTDCHTVHIDYEHSLKKAMPELCYDCHTDVRANFFMPSHHPVREGKMACLDCHGIHGGNAQFVQENTGRELCFTCHAEKEGPFVYEHAPVMEDCNLCHTPHGSVANNLLKQNEPVLCLNCHAMHFHAAVEGIDGDFTVPQNTTRNGVSTVDGFKKGFLTKCTQCHTEIHGSDLPSQALTTSGNALTR